MKPVSVIILLFLAMLFTLMSACFPKSSENIQTTQGSNTPTLSVTTPTSSIKTEIPLPTKSETPQVSVPAELMIPIENLIAKESEFVPINQTWSEETKILKLILGNLQKPPKYAVIKPLTFSWANYRDIEKMKSGYIKGLKTQGYDFSNLVNQLIENNLEPHLLTINSSLENGYFIDYTNHFDQFFANIKDMEANWIRWHYCYPNAVSHTIVSTPVYDAEQGYVMVCIGSNYYGSTYGNIVVYKYESNLWPYNQLKKIAIAAVWVS
jgi:hypothetical protein